MKSNSLRCLVNRTLCPTWKSGILTDRTPVECIYYYIYHEFGNYKISLEAYVVTSFSLNHWGGKYAFISKLNWKYKAWWEITIWSVNTITITYQKKKKCKHYIKIFINVVALWFVSPHNVLYGYWWALSVQNFWHSHK